MDRVLEPSFLSRSCSMSSLFLTLICKKTTPHSHHRCCNPVLCMGYLCITCDDLIPAPSLFTMYQAGRQISYNCTISRKSSRFHQNVLISVKQPHAKSRLKEMATNTFNQPLVEISIVTSPNNLEAVPGLLTDLKAGVSALSAGGREARQDLLIKARTLVQSLETPRETMLKHCWAQVSFLPLCETTKINCLVKTGAMSGLIFGVDTGLWKLMVENGEKPQKVSNLATSLGVEPLLLRKFRSNIPRTTLI